MKKQEKEITVRCKVFNHVFDGATYERHVHGELRWVAELQCSRCGSWRVDYMLPHSCLLTSRVYYHSDEYDTSFDRAEARKVLFKSLLVEEAN